MVEENAEQTKTNKSFDFFVLYIGLNIFLNYINMLLCGFSRRHLTGQKLP
jgi:hypothetical protein